MPAVVTPTATPGMVVTKIVTETPDTYFEQSLSPKEARTYAAQLILDADRAEAWEELQRRVGCVR